MHIFQPSKFVALESLPARWWINPALTMVAALGLAVAAGYASRFSKTIDRALGLRPVFDMIDRVMLGLLRGRVTQAVAGKSLDPIAAKVESTSRTGPTGNPIYWKETTVNTLGRLRHWMRVNLMIALLMVGSYAVFKAELGNIMFHKIVGGVLSGIIVPTATMIAATSVSKEREERTLSSSPRRPWIARST